MICSLSGEIPQEPVFSTKSGHVFEKRLLEKYLSSNDNRDPISKETVQTSDIIAIKVNKSVPPKPTTATSLPSLLQTFQNEWDAMVLESFQLKQQLDSTREQLAQTLYQHDASCRVIARLIKERDEARSLLSQANGQTQQQQQQQSTAIEIDQINLPSSVLEQLTNKAHELSKQRKQRKISETLALAEDVKQYKPANIFNGHKTSQPGISCLTVHLNSDLVLAGSLDGQIELINTSHKHQASLVGHSKKINNVVFHPTQDLVFSASNDKTARVWKKQTPTTFQTIHVVSMHTDDVTDVSVHPSGDYFVSTSFDNSWALHDLKSGNSLCHVRGAAGLTCGSFHPDGMLFGSGTMDKIIRIWDLKSQKNVVNFEGHLGEIVDISFSENGFYLASVSSDTTLKMWDLRKINCFETINLGSDFNTTSVCFDFSGNYLATAGKEIRLYAGKTLTHVTTLTGHTGRITDVCWLRDAKCVVTSSNDHTVKFWSKA